MEENISLLIDHHQIGFLPQDLLIQILVLLPVISLLRFKSVCKSWRALIQSSLFVDLHLNNTTLPPSTNNNNFGTFIYQTADYITLWEKKNEAFMLSADGGGGGGEGGDDGDEDEFEEELKLEDLGFPPRYKIFVGFHDIYMVGSCNGLICIHETKRREVSLWNPATRQFRLLPESLTLAGIGKIIDGLMYQDFVAFGYDVQTKDYKVVQISYFEPYNMSDDDNPRLKVSDYIFRVQVYSLSRDSWRILEGINYFPAIPEQPRGCNHGVYLNGSYYFMGWYSIDIEEVEDESRCCYMLLSFDFAKESFTTIQLPYDSELMPSLTYLGEKLAIFANVGFESDFDTYDIWVLNEEHGVKEEESWTKLHSIRLNCIGHYRGGTPRSISNNGEFVLIHNHADSVINGVQVSNCSLLQLFNLVTNEVKKEFRTGGVIRAEVYKQSLVSIGGNDTTTDRVIGAEI